MARKMWRHKITRAGQVSIPAEIRRRWESSTVAIVDEGDCIVLRPVPDDPIAALRGIFADDNPLTGAEAVRQARDEDIEAEEEKWKRRYGP